MLTASQITHDALLWFSAQKARVRRVNNIAVVKKRRNQVEPGWPDIEGYAHDGRVILCEVKTQGDKFSDEQIERLLDCEKCGGIARIAVEIAGSTQILTISQYDELFRTNGLKSLKSKKKTFA